MTTATQNNATKPPYELHLLNQDTGKRSSYRLEPGTQVADLVRDAIEHDLARAFADGQTRSIVITANPQRKH